MDGLLIQYVERFGDDESGDVCELCIFRITKY